MLRRLELRHCAQPIRAALQRTRFIEATVESVEVERQLVRAVAPEGGAYDLPYDHLVVALGASTNDRLIPGSSNAFTFKTMADALVLRNHLIGFVCGPSDFVERSSELLVQAGQPSHAVRTERLGQQENRASNVSWRLQAAGGRNRRRRASRRNADCCGRPRESSSPQSSRTVLRLQMPPAAMATPH
jgi:hypothetical protein